jgi:hypothetical protein
MEYNYLNLGYFAVLGLTLSDEELPKTDIVLPKATISLSPLGQKQVKPSISA